ncbi:Ca2+-transporting ATPase [Daejeonella rubra]|uniref:Ca2+-transporting ATPase n=1 Tax=Daejeonella rubra TaxID=990371 RepID=A0A1G9N2C4_9SPHI|nr:cation-translocating P-type ATPase [Daejeonella rubra]SDL80533.1 Ca2+-transporting ATPase [Daejeonella rubra]
MNWHNLDISEVAQTLNSSADGLESDDVRSRLSRYGKNEIVDGKDKYKVWKILLNQFSDFMIIILIIAAIISGIAADLTDTIIILSIIFINAFVGFIQEYKAEKALDALKSMARSQAEVFRNKELLKINSSELVPGDVITLKSGDVIPADIRFIKVQSLKVDESTLTGESENTEKNGAVLQETNLPIGDRTNMGYKGTFVTSGRGTAYVVETGMRTELGHIAKMIQKVDRNTPLQKKLAAFGKRLSLIILFICALIFISGWLRGESLMEMLLISISLAVAAIPEALPALVTISLALGAKKLVKQHVLVRKLPAVETLGSVSFICTDKTGTLTLNKMTVEKVFEIDKSLRLPGLIDKNSLLSAMALNSDVSKNDGEEWIGESTELALVKYALSKIYDKTDLETSYPRIAEIPFDSVRKCMSTLHQTSEGILVITKGAVEMLIQTPDIKNRNEIPELEKKVNAMSESGYRVLGYAYKLMKKLPEKLIPEQIESSLTLIGFAAMIDPPRKDVKEAISQCKEAGITPVMITGDHKLTASAIASSLGIISSTDDLVLTGSELADLNDEQFKLLVEKVKVYARVDPEQKLRIINALQSNNHFVAMTGDGVNDAPALKNADIGIAMGINGTEVSKEAAHMILLDDNFSTIVKAIRHGRKIFDNILKFIKYIMTGNSGEIWAITLAPFLGLPIPLLAIHILWINLVTDGLPGLALASEPAEPSIMSRTPRNPNHNIFESSMAWHILWVGLLMALVTLGIQAWAINNNNPNGQTMAFSVLCFIQLGHAMAIRSNKESVFRIGIFSNKPMVLALLLTVLLQMLIIYMPALNEIFKTKPLSLSEMAITIAASSIVFLAVEIEKFFKSE